MRISTPELETVCHKAYQNRGRIHQLSRSERKALRAAIKAFENQRSLTLPTKKQQEAYRSMQRRVSGKQDAYAGYIRPAKRLLFLSPSLRSKSLKSRLALLHASKHQSLSKRRTRTFTYEMPVRSDSFNELARKQAANSLIRLEELKEDENKSQETKLRYARGFRKDLEPTLSGPICNSIGSDIRAQTFTAACQWDKYIRELSQ